MKKFNLEEALAGKPVITREGKKVLEVISFKKNLDFNIFAIIEGRPSSEAYTKEGKFLTYEDHHLDLFMATEKKTMWLGIMKDLPVITAKIAYFHTTVLFMSKESLEISISKTENPSEWTIIPVEIEV